MMSRFEELQRRLVLLDSCQLSEDEDVDDEDEDVDGEEEARQRSEVLRARLAMFDSLPPELVSEDESDDEHDDDDSDGDESNVMPPSSPAINSHTGAPIVSPPICTEDFTFLPGCSSERTGCRDCPVTYRSNKDLAAKAMSLNFSAVSVA